MISALPEIKMVLFLISKFNFIQNRLLCQNNFLFEVILFHIVLSHLLQGFASEYCNPDVAWSDFENHQECVFL